MDIVSVTDNALQKAYVTLKQLKENSESITTLCTSNISSQLSNIDSIFRKDLNRYIEMLTDFEKKLIQCIDENILALNDRYRKIPDYVNSSYKKRKIV